MAKWIHDFSKTTDLFTRDNKTGEYAIIGVKEICNFCGLEKDTIDGEVYFFKYGITYHEETIALSKREYARMYYHSVIKPKREAAKVKQEVPQL